MVRCKGKTTKPSDINVVEEWAFPSPLGICPPVHIGGAISEKITSAIHGKNENSSLTLSQQNQSKSESNPTGRANTQSNVNTNQASPKNKPEKVPSVVLKEVAGVVLSFYNNEYRNIMFDQFKQLGKRPSRRSEIQAHVPAEKQLEKKLFANFQQKKVRRGGHFFKKDSLSHNLYEVGDKEALEKIATDIRIRNEKLHRWLVEAEEPTLRCYRRRGDPTKTRALGFSRGPDTITLALEEVVGVTLCYYNDEYREIMFDHFRKIGERPTSVAGRREHKPVETAIGNDIFAILKQKLGKNGHFYKKLANCHNLKKVGDDLALEKILLHLRMRNNCTERWFQDHIKPTYKPDSGALEVSPSNLRIVPSSIKEVGKQNFVLSWYNDEYTDIMHSYFRKMGLRQVQNHLVENKIGKEIVAKLKKKLGKTGHFFKKSHKNNDLVEIGDDEALEKILKDLRARNGRVDKWFPAVCENRMSRSRPSSSLRLIPSSFIKVREQDFALSWFNEEYTDIMHDLFKKLGERPTCKVAIRAQKLREDKLGHDVFATLKNKLGRGGRFLKKSHISHDLFETNDNEALQKVLKDLHSRNKRIEKWL